MQQIYKWSNIIYQQTNFHPKNPIVDLIASKVDFIAGSTLNNCIAQWVAIVPLLAKYNLITKIRIAIREKHK